jgi:serine/threonine protein phosphatase PrpC
MSHAHDARPECRRTAVEGTRRRLHIECWADSHVGLVRRNNEDAIGCFPELRLFMVADGMGGHNAGEVASRMAVDVIRGVFRQERLRQERAARLLYRLWRLGRPHDPGQSPDGLLRAAVELANRKIFAAGRRSQGQPDARPMGTTAVVLYLALHDACAYWAHVGDSRLYRLRGDGLQLLTVDHTAHGKAYRQCDSAPLDLPHTNVLLQALGPAQSVDVAVRVDELRGGDRFLLCSDGISGFVDPAFIQRVLQESATLAAAGEQLIQGSLAAGGKDNASAVLVHIAE